MKKVLLLLAIIPLFSFCQDIQRNVIRKKVITENSKQFKRVTIYKRQFLQERLFMILLNLTRVVTFHQPLISLGTFKMTKGAAAHSLDMYKTNNFNHYNIDKRKDEYNFRGENIIFHSSQSTFTTVGNAFMKYWGWMHSEGHRKNMMRWDYFFTGLGFYKIKEKKIYNIKNKSSKSELLKLMSVNPKKNKHKKVIYYGTQVFK